MADTFDPAEYKKVKDQFDPEEFAKVKQGGLGEASNFDFVGSAKRTGKHIYDNYLEKQFFPAVTSMAATRIPAVAIGGPAGLIAAPVVEGLYQFGAGVLGEKLNQFAGVTPESNNEALGQGGMQGLVAAGGKAFSMLKPFAGRSGAVATNEIAAKEGRRVVQQYKPAMESDVAFDEAFKEGATIPMNQTAAVMKRVMSPVGGQRTLSYAYGPAARDIRVIESELASGKPMSAKQWQFLHTRLGQTIGTMESAGQKKGLDRAKQLYAAMLDDLERVAENEVRPQNAGMVSGGAEPGPYAGGPTIVRQTQTGPEQIDRVYEARPVKRPPGVYAPGIEGAEQPRLYPPGIEGPQPAPQLGGTETRRDVGFATPGPNKHTNQVPGAAGRQQGPGRAEETVEPGREYTLNQDITDVPKAPGTGASKLKMALDTYRKEKSVGEITNYMERAMKPLKGQGGDMQFNAAEVMRNLRTDRFYTKAFTAEERKDIEGTLELLNTVPNLPLHKSVNAGSKRMMERGAESVAGGTAGAFVGGLPGMAAGAAAGFFVRDVRDVVSNLSFALSTKTGRELIKELAKTKGGVMTPRNMAVLTSYVSALRHDPDSEMAKPPTPRPFGSDQLQPAP